MSSLTHIYDFVVISSGHISFVHNSLQHWNAVSEGNAMLVNISMFASSVFILLTFLCYYGT